MVRAGSEGPEDSHSIPSNLRLGTSSWSCDDWVGPFYPPGTRPADYLPHYATVLGTVEVDSTFYAVPSARTVDGWREKTPPGFTIAAKVPKVITHEKRLEDCDSEMRAFLDVISRLEDRRGPLLLQFPYFPRGEDPIEYETGDAFRARLERFLEAMPSGFRFAVEVRNEPWVRPRLLEFLRQRGAALALLDYFTMPPIHRLLRVVDPVTTDFLYVRLLGNHKAMDQLVADRARRSGDGRRWHALALDRTPEMARWVPALRALCPRVTTAWVFVNNHYAGYAPGSIDLLKRLFEDSAG